MNHVSNIRFEWHGRIRDKNMRKECHFSNAVRNPYAAKFRNPYAAKLKKQITNRLDEDVVEYFKAMAVEFGMPCEGCRL